MTTGWISEVRVSRVRGRADVGAAALPPVDGLRVSVLAASGRFPCSHPTTASASPRMPRFSSSNRTSPFTPTDRLRSHGTYAGRPSSHPGSLPMCRKPPVNVTFTLWTPSGGHSPGDGVDRVDESMAKGAQETVGESVESQLGGAWCGVCGGRRGRPVVVTTVKPCGFVDCRCRDWFRPRAWLAARQPRLRQIVVSRLESHPVAPVTVPMSCCEGGNAWFPW